MAKKSTQHCEFCGRSFKNKHALVAHHCFAKTEKKCKLCYSSMLPRNLERHYHSCEANFLLQKYLPFCLFFYKLVRAYNRGIKVINFMGRKREKKDFLKAYFKKNDISDYPDINKYKKQINKEIKFRYNLACDKLLTKLDGINTNGFNLQVLLELENNLHPLFSAREFIFNFLEEEGITNEKVYETINKKMKKDYPTDEEIQNQSEELYNKILHLRHEYITYNNMYHNFKELMNKYNSTKFNCFCPFCEKFHIRPKLHLKNCTKAAIAFYSDKASFIEYYIQAFFDLLKLKDSEEIEIVNYFVHFNYLTFLKYVNNFVKSKIKVVEQIEKEQESKEKIKTSKHYTGKMFLEEFLKEYDNEKKITENETKSEENGAKIEEKKSYNKMNEIEEKESEKILVLHTNSEESSEKNEIENEKLKKDWNKLLDGKKLGETKSNNKKIKYII